MNLPYKVIQRIYLERAFCTGELIEDVCGNFSAFLETNSIHDSVVVPISVEHSRTISENFTCALPKLIELKNLLTLQNYSGEILLQIYIKAYEYMPEISFSREMIKFLAEISAEIDVDLIDLIDA